MNKFYLLFICTVFSFKALRAQYVNIDPKFKEALFEQDSSIIRDCFNNSGQLDTSCSDLLKITTLTFDYQYTTVVNFGDIKYFKGLKELIIDGSTNAITYSPII